MAAVPKAPAAEAAPKCARNIAGGGSIATPRDAAKRPQYADFSGICGLRGASPAAMGRTKRKRADGQIEVQTEAEIRLQTKVRRAGRPDVGADRRRIGTARTTAERRVGFRFGRRLHLAAA